MDFNSWVIIASPELSDSFSYLCDLYADRGVNRESVDVYACNVEKKSEILGYMEKLVEKWRDETEQTETLLKNIAWMERFADAIRANVYEKPMPVALKEGIICQIRCSFHDSWKYIDKLQDDERYIYLTPVDIRTMTNERSEQKREPVTVRRVRQPNRCNVRSY